MIKVTVGLIVSGYESVREETEMKKPKCHEGKSVDGSKGFANCSQSHLSSLWCPGVKRFVFCALNDIRIAINP